MQYAYENLEHTILHGKVEQVITTRADDAADAAVSIERAQSHTRPQLEMLITQLRKRHDAAVGAGLKESLKRALAPLEARLQRYHDAERRVRDKAAKAKLRREEVEFKEMMANWLKGVDGDALEQSFVGVCYWQVENAHQRDRARDKRRMRAEHTVYAKKHEKLRTAPLRWLGKHAYSAVSSQRVRPEVPAKLSYAEFERRVDALVSAWWA